MIQKLLSAIEYILNECHKAPDDSVVDIANEAFSENDLNIIAEWDGDEAIAIRSDDLEAIK